MFNKITKILSIILNAMLSMYSPDGSLDVLIDR